MSLKILSLHFLDIVSRAAAMDIAELTSVEPDVMSFRHMLRSAIVGLYGRFIF